jgi:hypothetical protein
MSRCVFCGYSGKLTGEHVVGNWVARSGLDLNPLPHEAGPLNHMGKSMGTRPPFRQTVRDVCGECNHGWMSRLEGIAQRVLTPCILGNSSVLSSADLSAVAAWTQKTALTAMLVSSEQERKAGYGLPSAEYHALYDLRDALRPLPSSQFWIGKYVGVRSWSVRVTPLVVRTAGRPEPARPQGYAMTVLLGQMIICGVRFTTSTSIPQLAINRPLQPIWPDQADIGWPAGEIGDAEFLDVAAGKDLVMPGPHFELQPWTAATELRASRLVRGVVELPAICHQHVIHYPAELFEEARRGRFYAFVSRCECPITYLIITAQDGAHFKASGTDETIGQLFEELAGQDYQLRDHHGAFECRLITDRFG